MKLTNLLPDEHTKTLFLGRDEKLDITLNKEFPEKKVVRMIQTHSNTTAFLDEEVMNQAEGEILFLDSCDGVFTDQKEVVLVVKAADCYPILFYHPSGIIGAIHAGRKGTEQEIVKKALSEIKEERGLDRGWILWLGPKICFDCYQINKETDEHYDLQAHNVAQIQSELDGELNFALDCQLCTAHQNDWFYSYRKEGKGVKMNYGLISLK